MSEMTAEKLESLVKAAVQEAMKVGALECPDCHATFTEPARYMDHRIAEFVTKKFTEAKAPDPQKFVLECEGDICKLVEKHVETTYDMTKKGEAASEAAEGAPEGTEEKEEPGLFSLVDDEEEE